MLVAERTRGCFVRGHRIPVGPIDPGRVSWRRAPASGRGRVGLPAPLAPPSDDLRPEYERARDELIEHAGPILGAQAAALGADRLTRAASAREVDAMSELAGWSLGYRWDVMRLWSGKRWSLYEAAARISSSQPENEIGG